MTAAEVLKELAAIGSARADDYMTVEDGQLRLLDWSQLPREKLAAVAAVEKSSTGLKVKFYDKLKALELVGKIIGMFDGNVVQVEENNLLNAILQATGEEVNIDDLSEVQQAADAGTDLVEPPGTEEPGGNHL